MVKYGLIPEFVGRLPVVATLHELGEDALVEILTQPKNALVKQFQSLFKMEGATLEFQDEALHSIAKKALARKIGARGLRSIIETILLNTMYELPSMDCVTGVLVNEQTVTEHQEPVLIYGSEETEQTAVGGVK